MATDMAADATPASGDDAGRVDLAVVNDAEGLVEEPDQVCYAALLYTLM